MLYIIIATGCTDPHLQGPYETEKERNAMALNFYQNTLQHGEDVMFRLDIDATGKPSVFPFINDFLPDDEDSDDEFNLGPLS